MRFRLLLFTLLGLITPVFADKPKPWQIGFQDPASTKMVALENMHHFLFVIISLIAIVVVSLLVFVIFRFHEKRSPTPSKTTHNTLLEVIWTAIPALIVAAIAVPSVKLIYDFDRTVEADLTIKVTGHQWYWSYEYEGKNVGFDSYLIPDNELKPGQMRNFEVDNRLVVPAGKIIKLHITSADVIHAFAVPSFGIQKNAIPGRINETWFKVDKPGVYYGQCWAICGVKHGFMPIAIEVVQEDQYNNWIASKTPPEPVKAPEAVANSPKAAEPPKGSGTPEVAKPGPGPDATKPTPSKDIPSEKEGHNTPKKVK